MQTIGGTLMDVRSLKRNVLRDESSQNILLVDGEGWKLPENAKDYSLLSSDTVAYGWKNNSAAFSSLFGKAGLNTKHIEAFSGNGSTLAFTGGTFTAAVKTFPLSVLAVIGGAVKGWTDTDGARQAITNRIIGVGTGAALSFTIYTGTTSIRPTTLTLKHTEGGNLRTSGADNGSGAFAGVNIASATVNYETGAIAITFTNAPDIATNITVSYTVDSYLNLEESESLATANGTATTFQDLFTTYTGIKARSVRIAAAFSSAVAYFVDNGSGTLVELGAGGFLTSGTINTTTGEVDMVFSVAPDADSFLHITYQRVGLNRMSITHATGADLEVRFDTGNAPDNATKVIGLASFATGTEFAGNGVTSGLYSIGNATKKAGFRSNRSFTAADSEDYYAEYATLRAQPGSVYALSFYGRVSISTGACYIRAWDGNTSPTQISFGATAVDFESLTGDVTRVVDPADGSKFCLKCTLGTALTRFGAMIKVPAGAYCVSMEWEGDETNTYFGKQALFVSGIQWNVGSQLMAYTPNPSSRLVPLPVLDVIGRFGQALTSDGSGGTAWADIPSAGGGGGGTGIVSLNTLTAATQVFATGTAGTAPAFNSSVDTHTLDIPLASASTNVTGGLLSGPEYAALATMPSATTTTTNTGPTFVADTNGGYDLTIPLASGSTNVVAGLLSNAEYLALAGGGSSLTIDLTANSNGITAGNVVELTSTGGQNVQNIYHCEAPTIGSLVDFDTGAATFISASKSTTNSAMIAWSDTSTYGKIALFTVGATNIGNTLTFSGANAATLISSDRLSDTETALSWYRFNTGAGYTAIVTHSGTDTPTITDTSAGANLPSMATVNTATCALTSSSYFVSYVETDGTCKIRTCISNGTSAPTLGTALNITVGSAADYLSLARLGNSDAMLVHRWDAGSNAYTQRIAGGTTNIPTTSSQGLLDGTNNCTFITQSSIDSDHTLCAYNNSTTSNGCLAVIQANGASAPTVISRAVFNSTAVSYCSLTSHSANLHTLVCQRTDSPYTIATSINVDSNYNITFSQLAPVNHGAYNAAYMNVAALTPTQAIAAFADSSGTYGYDGFAGTLTLTPTPIISGQLVGIATSSATNGADASVCVGPVFNTTNTLVLGSDYYANVAGGLTTNVTPIHVGKAESTNSMLLELRGAPEAGRQQVWEITTPGAFTWTAPEDGEYRVIACGGGGSGAFSSTQGLIRATSGNGGNTVCVDRRLSKGSAITGTIGSGGVAKTSDGDDGAAGTSSSIVLLGTTFTAAGGRGGVYLLSNPVSSSSVENIPNAMLPNNLRGISGFKPSTTIEQLDKQYGGLAPLITSFQATCTSGLGRAGLKGGGGSGGNAARSGAGGDGVCRIELIHGS